MKILKCPNCNLRLYVFDEKRLEKETLLTCGGIVDSDSGLYTPYYRLRQSSEYKLSDPSNLHYGCKSILKVEFKIVKCHDSVFKEPHLVSMVNRLSANDIVDH